MMYGRIFAVLFLILPAFVYGLKCDVGISCTYSGAGAWQNSTAGQKDCSSCVYFGCTQGFNAVVYGSGCYEDFATVCNTTLSNDMRDKIKKNLNNFTYGDDYKYLVMASSNSSIENQTAADMFKEAKKNSSIMGVGRMPYSRFKPVPYYCGITADGKLLGDNNTIPATLPPLKTTTSKGTQTAAFGLTGMAIIALTFILL